MVRDREGSWIHSAIVPLRDVFVGERKQTVTVMLVAVLGFLLLACANVAALLGARASVREHEHAVRSALGASRASLARQSALEAVILVLVGGALGLWPALIGMRFANEEYLDWLGNTPARLDLWVALGLAGLLLLAALTAALTPVLLLRRVQPMDVLRGAGKTSESLRARRVREALVALQVAATVALLVSAGLVVRSVRAMLAVDAGIDIDGVVIGSVVVPTETRTEGPEGFAARRVELQHTVRALRARLERMPNVAHACVAGDLPFDFLRFSRPFEGDAGRPPQPADSHWITPGCLSSGASATGVVRRVAPAAHAGTVEVEVGFEPGALPAGARPDQNVDGSIEIERVDDALHVARPLALAAGGRVELFRLDPQARTATRVTVRLGRISLDRVEVLSGLEPGDEVVLSDMSRHAKEAVLLLD